MYGRTINMVDAADAKRLGELYGDVVGRLFG
jgi:hypothetical protein